MSHFIANKISFSKDKKQFRVKGGDNNVIPRSNSWSNWIDVTELYYLLSGGSLQFNTLSSERKALVQYIANSFEYGGYYSVFNKNAKGELVGEEKIKFDIFNENFISALTTELKSISHKKNYVVKTNGKFFGNSRSYKYFYSTHNIESAQRFSKYVGIMIAKRFSHIGAYTSEIK